jgi:hypothetical protein
MMKSVLLALGASLLATVAAASTSSPFVLQSGVSQTVSVLEDDGNLLNDQTWFVFDVAAGSNISITATSASDACIELYSGDVTGLDFGGSFGDCGTGSGSSLLSFVGSNDDDFVSLNSFLSTTASVTGRFSLYVNDLFVNGTPTTVTATFTPAAAIPLPAGGLLLLSGFIGMAALRRRK